MSRNSERGHGPVPRASQYRRTIRFREGEFAALGALAAAGGVSRGRLIHSVVSGWLRLVSKSKAAGKRVARLPFCCHSESAWVRYEGEAPWCPSCARPCCESCRRFYRLRSLRCDRDGDPVAIYVNACGCSGE